MNKKDFIRERAIAAKREWLENNSPKPGEAKSEELINAIVGANMRVSRNNKGLSLQDVVEMSGGSFATRSSLSLIELGEQNITIYQLYSFARIIGCKVEHLLEGI